MKAPKKELDVDFIGSQKPLTDKEQKALSDYFVKLKMSVKSKGSSRSNSKTKRSGVTVVE